MTWEKDTQELTIIIRYGEERGSLVRGGGGNRGKPDKKDIKKEETKQKTMNLRKFETKSNTMHYATCPFIGQPFKNLSYLPQYCTV